MRTGASDVRASLVMSATTRSAPASRSEAAARLDASARAVVRTWRLAVLATSGFTALWVGMVAMALAVDRLLYVLPLAMAAAASAYNVTRFLPRVPEERDAGVVPAEADVRRMRADLQAACGVAIPERVMLTASPLVRIDDDGVLRIGLAPAVCLSAEQLGALVEDAATRHQVATGAVVLRARRIGEGRLGRGLENGGRLVSRRLLAGVEAVSAEFYESLHECIRAEREPHLDAWAGGHSAQDVVVEAWALVSRRWLDPATDDGLLVDTPFSAVRELWDAAAAMGLTDGRSPDPDPLLEPAPASVYELDVARTMSTQGDELAPVSWDAYPAVVLEPSWRRRFAGGLAGIARVTGAPHPATLASVVGILEQGWAETLTMGLGHPSIDADTHEDVVPALLTAATWLAVLETPGSTLAWSWPFGPQAVLSSGEVVDVEGMVARALDEVGATGALDGFRRSLAEVGIDLDAPIWLDEGVAPPPDRVLASAVANTGWRKNVVLVLSEQAVRVFDTSYVDATRRDLRLQMVGPHEALQPIMERVERAEAGAPAIEVMVRDVVHAELASILGGMYWRLVIRTVLDRKRTTVFGIGAPGLVEDVLRVQLGDRLVTRWLHLPPALATARAWVTCLLVGFGILMVVSGPVAALSGDASVSDALAISVLGLAVVALVLIPGIVLSALATRRRRRRTAVDR